MPFENNKYHLIYFVTNECTNLSLNKVGHAYFENS